MSSPRIIHVGLWKIKTDVEPSEVARVDKLVQSFKTKIQSISFIKTTTASHFLQFS